MILVVNETVAAPDHVSVANQEFAAGLHARFSMSWQPVGDSGLTLYADNASSRDLLLVDRYSDGRQFPPKGGVGLARKTGADLAAYLVHQRRVLSPWIHCTDADVRLPQRYFTSSAALGEDSIKDTAALVYPFRHTMAGDKAVDEIMRATALYEYSLHYYVTGLSSAGSPYAFHTIGSTMAVNAVHYAKVRGFPRRQAGEDFYLLNKLAKVGSIRQLGAETDCEPIDIAARRSDRVPFGTGAAVGKLLELENPEKEFLLYHPSVFILLRSWLDSLPAFWQSRSSDIGAILSSADVQGLVGGLEQLGATQALQHALRQSSDIGQFNRQMHTWFDAFRTLKLIHYLRDHHLPSISYEVLAAEHKTLKMDSHE